MQPLRILKYPWHTGHDYELVKLPHHFYFLSNTYREWALSQRPLPAAVQWVPTADAVETDLMILHVDQWTLGEPAKRILFESARDAYPGPKVVINHGCNMVDGCSSAAMAELLRGCWVVCNSSTAHQLWNLPTSRFIRHGMSPEEWPSTDYAHHNILVVQHHSNLHAGFRNNDGVRRAERFVPITWIGRDKHFSCFNTYRHFLKSSSVFFNPSYASPNPRARTEAMLSGLAIVTTNMHGESEYIQNGANGFCSNDFDELIDYLMLLEANPRLARRMGAAGRETAQSVFHIDKFIAQWNELLQEVVATQAPQALTTPQLRVVHQ